MKQFVRTMFFSAMLLLGLAAVAPAQDDGPCSYSGRAGVYAAVWTGWIITPSGAVPMANVGIATFDAAGNFSVTGTASQGGKLTKGTAKGTYTVNPDCSGTLTASSYDAAGNLASKMTADVVSTDNMNETRGIMTSLVLPDGTNMPVVITLDAKKLSPLHTLRLVLDSALVSAAR